MTRPAIPGYDFGSPDIATSPFSIEDFNLLSATVLLGEGDLRALRLAGEVLDDQVEAVLDVWYGFVGSHPHLVKYFSGADGQANADYLTGVRRRFGQWIRDTCAAKYDRAWLDYQEEIGRRHTRALKNRTDAVLGGGGASVVHLRYLVAFIVPLTLTIRPFLASKGHDAETVDAMYHAWFKAVTLTAVLWSRPYVPAEDF